MNKEIIKNNIQELEKQWKLRNQEKEIKVKEIMIIMHEQTRLINEEKEQRNILKELEKQELERVKKEGLKEEERKICYKEIKELKEKKNEWIEYRNENENKDHWISYLSEEGKTLWHKVNIKIEEIEKIIGIKYKIFYGFDDDEINI